MSDCFDRVERQIVRRVEDGLPRSARLPSAGGYVAVAAAVLVVIVVVGAFLLARGGAGNGAPNPTAAAAGAKVAFDVSSAAPPAVVGRSAQILRERLHAAVPAAQVSVAGRQIVVTVAHARAGIRSQILTLAAPGVLGFYDWEAEVLGPNGKPVASQIPSPDPAVLGISQGAGSSAPGEVGAGCVSLAQALALAAKADADAPRHTEYIGRMRLRVPIPYVVLEAASAPPGRPTDGFFVLRITRSVLSGEDITNPRARSDGSSGAHSVTFGFTAGGRRAFQSLTAGIARRGSQVSSPGQTLNQHFAIVLDNQLIGVPYIDYRVYPDGIKGENGADISGDFTTQFARDLAILLRYGPLPVQLTATG